LPEMLTVLSAGAPDHFGAPRVPAKLAPRQSFEHFGIMHQKPEYPAEPARRLPAAFPPLPRGSLPTLEGGASIRMGNSGTLSIGAGGWS
jgi:hypothetical protein